MKWEKALDLRGQEDVGRIRRDPMIYVVSTQFVRLLDAQEARITELEQRALPVEALREAFCAGAGWCAVELAKGRRASPDKLFSEEAAERYPDTDAGYVCPLCRGRYRRNPGPQASCCVAHAPGSCCHFNETRLDTPRVEHRKAQRRVQPERRKPAGPQPWLGRRSSKRVERRDLSQSGGRRACSATKHRERRVGVDRRQETP